MIIIRKNENFDGVIYMPCLEFKWISSGTACRDTGSDLSSVFRIIQVVQQYTKDKLQEWVDYANENGSVIIYDAAYEAYITEENVPHSIYECEGARTCAIELRSFSKNAGFTGVRLGFTVVPKDLVREGVALHDLWARRHWNKINGAPYIYSAQVKLFNHQKEKHS